MSLQLNVDNRCLLSTFDVTLSGEMESAKRKAKNKKGTATEWNRKPRPLHLRCVFVVHLQRRASCVLAVRMVSRAYNVLRDLLGA